MPDPAPATPRTGSLPGVEGSVDASKQALLTAIAQQGQTGQAAFTAEAARQQAAQQAAIANIAAQTAGGSGRGFAAPAALTAQLGAQQTALQNIYDMDRTMAQTTFGNSFGLVRDSNAAYMDQARAAVPALRAQTDGLVAQERARLEQERMQMEQARLDAIEAQKEREFRQWEREQERLEREALAQEDEQALLEEQYVKTIERRQGEEAVEWQRDDLKGYGYTNDQGEAVPLSAVLDSIVSVAPDLRSALLLARESYDDTPDERQDQQRLINRLTAWYTGAPLAASQDDLAARLQAVEIDPTKTIPGYVPGGEQGRGEDRPRQQDRPAPRPTPRTTPRPRNLGGYTNPRGGSPSPDRGSVLDQILNRLGF